MSGVVSKTIYRGLKNRHFNERNQGTHRVYAVKKDGTLRKAPHVAPNGRNIWSEEEAAKEAARMTNLNPGSRYVAVEA